MSGFSAHQAEAVACIDDQRQRFSDFNLKIWNFAEPAWREYKSVRAYIDLLRTDGWEVEESSGGMPTAFAATWSRGRGGPVLGSYAEYDAVPGNSQQIAPRRGRARGCIRGLPGIPTRIRSSAPPRWWVCWRPRR